MLESLCALGVDQRVFYSVQGFLFCATYLVTLIAADDSGAISFVDGDYARAVAGSVEVVVSSRRRCRHGTRAARFPCLHCLAEIGSRVGFSVVKLGGDEHRPLCHCPYLSLLYGAARRGPTSRVGLCVPDQDASQGPSSPLGQLAEINTNTSQLQSEV